MLHRRSTPRRSTWASAPFARLPLLPRRSGRRRGLRQRVSTSAGRCEETLFQPYSTLSCSRTRPQRKGPKNEIGKEQPLGVSPSRFSGPIPSKRHQRLVGVLVLGRSRLYELFFISPPAYHSIGRMSRCFPLFLFWFSCAWVCLRYKTRRSASSFLSRRTSAQSSRAI